MLRRFGRPSGAMGLLLVLGVGLLAAIVAASFFYASRADALATRLMRQQELIAALPRSLLLLQDLETGQRGYLLTGDEDYLDPYEAALDRVAETKQSLQRLYASDPASRELLTRLLRLIDDKLEEMSRTIELRRQGRAEEAMAIVRSDAGKEAMDAARAILSSLIARASAEVAALRRQISENAQAATASTAIGALLVLAVAVLLVLLVRRVAAQQARAREQIEALNAGLEARVAERTLALTRANEEVQRFAYIVSHDLRAPLVNIVGFSSELDSSTATLGRFLEALPPDAVPEPVLREARMAIAEDIPEAVSFIRASTAKMDKLINAILHLSREGRRPLRGEAVDLNELLARSFASLQHQIDETGASIAIQQAMPTIVSDRLALEQILGNLIDNALKYRAPGRAPRLSVSWQRLGKFVQITLADNGRGIAEQDYERIFELFRRAGKQDAPGEGIGLSHVRALARRLGGDITVTSSLGEGSRFLITLPLVFNPEDDAKSTR